MNPNDEKYRLSNMRTKEVSVVDAAANKKKFLIKKRSDAMNGPELSEKDNGELTEINKDKEGSQGTLQMCATWKAAIADGAAVALDKITELVETVKGADEVEDEDGLEFPAEIIKGLSEIAEAIQAVPTGIEKAASTHQALLDEQSAAVKAVAEKIATGKLTGTELTDAVDKLSSIAWKMRGPAEVVELSKSAGGHWMSQMKGLFDELKKVLEDFKAAMPKPGKPASNVGVGTQPDPEVVSSYQEVMQQIQGLEGLSKSMERFNDSIKELDGLKGAISKAHVEINKLKNGIDLPASQESEQTTTAKGEDDTTWPRDLAS